MKNDVVSTVLVNLFLVHVRIRNSVNEAVCFTSITQSLNANVKEWMAANSKHCCCLLLLVLLPSLIFLMCLLFYCTLSHSHSLTCTCLLLLAIFHTFNSITCFFFLSKPKPFLDIFHSEETF